MCTYRLNTDIVFDEDGNSVTVYGVTAENREGKMLESVRDVFFSEECAKDFVALCNRENLYLIHLSDVIEDKLYESYTVN